LKFKNIIKLGYVLFSFRRRKKWHPKIMGKVCWEGGKEGRKEGRRIRFKGPA
jgi:hypothetical protein